MDLSNLLYEFVRIVKGICQSCFMYIRPLPNKTKLKFDRDFIFELQVLNESKYPMPGIHCAFGNVLNIHQISRNHNIGLGLPEIALSALYSLVCVGTNHIVNQFANQIHLTSSTPKRGSKISLRKNNPCNLRALRGKDKTLVELPILLQLLKLPTICVH